jgi:uncharacterized protein YciI
MPQPLILTIALSLVLAAPRPQGAAPAPKLDMQVRELVFLVEAPHPPTLDAAGARALEEAHRARLEALYTARTALIVGTLEDAGRIHGLVLLDVGTTDEAARIMADDPIVKAGRLVAEVHAIFIARNVPQKGPAFRDLEALWFGFLRRPADAPAMTDAELEDIQKGHMANMERMAAAGKLLIAGPFEEDTDLRGIFIFRTATKDEAQELEQHDPAVQKHRLVLDLYRFYTTRGTFPAGSGSSNAPAGRVTACAR